MCHAPAECFKINNRGYLREGYFADMVLVDLENSFTVDKSNILYKCGWSPLEGKRFNNLVSKTFVNGHIAYENGVINDVLKGERLTFSH